MCLIFWFVVVAIRYLLPEIQNEVPEKFSKRLDFLTADYADATDGRNCRACASLTLGLGKIQEFHRLNPGAPKIFDLSLSVTQRGLWSALGLFVLAVAYVATPTGGGFLMTCFLP